MRGALSVESGRTRPHPAAADVPVVDEGTWFGPADRPLTGRLHLPADRRVRGAVVLCPGIGHEHALAYPGARRLGQVLAGARVAALHLSYDGAGEAWGDERDPDRLGAWRASIVAATAHLRALGVDEVALLGHRVGAELAASVADETRAAALVRLDPLDGRAFARRVRALAAMQGFPAGDGETAADGMIFTGETLAALKAWRTPDPADLPTLTVVGEHDAVAPVGETWPRPGLEGLVPYNTALARVPEDVVDEVSRWLADRMRGAEVEVGATAASTCADGVRETYETVDGLSAVVSEPATGARADLPTVVLLTTSLDPRTGPARGWVPWARQLAGLGFRTVRADLSGAGDSPARLGPPSSFGPAAVPDVRALVAAYDTGAGVALVGLCSGARNAVDATDPGGGVTDLLLVNPVLRPRRAQLAALPMSTIADDTILQPSYERLTPRMRVALRVPHGAWRLAYSLGLFTRQTDRLRAALRSGVQVAVVYAPDDFVMLEPRPHHRASMRRLARTGGFTVTEVAIDHAMVGPEGRRDALAVLTAHLVGRYLRVDDPR